MHPPCGRVRSRTVTARVRAPELRGRGLGRLLATDLKLPSLYADPLLILDLDEAVGKIGAELPSLAAGELRRLLSDRSRRFVWVARGLSPRHAQRIHELGLPGLGFRTELKRAYPMGALAGHVLGAVNLDNRGLAGIERMRSACKSAKKSCDIIVYPNTPHAFNADYRPSYRAAEAKDGWQRMLAFFKKHLG